VISISIIIPVFNEEKTIIEILKKVNYAYCLSENLTKYRIRKNSLQSNKIRNLYWIWYINKNYNKLSFFDNLISLLYISINSLKKYGFK